MTWCKDKDAISESIFRVSKFEKVPEVTECVGSNTFLMALSAISRNKRLVVH